MKKLALLLLLSSPAQAMQVEEMTLDFRTGCTPSGKTVCVTAGNFADYFLFFTGPGEGSGTPETCSDVYFKSGLGNNAELTADGLALTVKAEETTNTSYTSPADTNCTKNTQTYAYSGARLHYRNYCKFCRFDISAKLPVGTGLWSSLWAFGENSGMYGEIDMIEFLGKYTDGRYFTSFHYSDQTLPRNILTKTVHMSAISTAYHTYSVDLDGEFVTVFIDAMPVHRYPRKKVCNQTVTGQAESVDCGTVQPFYQPYTIIMSSSGGGTSWAGNIDPAAVPASMSIQTIKISKLDPNVKNAGFPLTAGAADYLQ